jgi:chitin synthase
MSFATNVNPYADKTSPNENPSDEELLSILRGYLGSQDLMTVTKK